MYTLLRCLMMWIIYKLKEDQLQSLWNVKRFHNFFNYPHVEVHDILYLVQISNIFKVILAYLEVLWVFQRRYLSGQCFNCFYLPK